MRPFLVKKLPGLRGCATLAAALLAASPMGAQEATTQAPPAAAAQPAADGDGPVISVGAAVFWAQSPIVGTDDRVLPVPFFTLEWGRFYFEGTEAGVKLGAFAGVNVKVAVRADLQFWDPDDSAYLDGMDKRDPTMQAGLSLSLPLGNGFEATVAGWQDVLDVHGGWDVDLGINRPIFLTERLILAPGAGVTIIGGSKARYYYGVRTSEALPGRPAYDPGTTWEANAGLMLRYVQSEHLSYFLLFGASIFSPDIEDSPIVDDNIVLGGGGGFAWKF